MDQKQIVKQMMDVQRVSFDNGYNTITSLQDQGEKMLNAFLDQATWIPAEGKGMVNEWVNVCKKGRDDFKKAVDDGYKKAEEIFGNTKA